MKSYLWIVVAMTTASCATLPTPPQVTIGPTADAVAMYTATCQALYREEFGREADAEGSAGCVAEAKAGRTGEQLRAILREFPEYAARQARLAAEAAAAIEAARHVDPSTIPLEQLAAIRGAMWTARWNGDYGPRPGQPDNILAMDFYALYPASERARMLDTYRAPGYTHGVIGPLSGTDCYHDKYPCHDPSNPGAWPTDGPPSQAQWDFFLDRVQEWWDHGCLGTGQSWPACGVASIFFGHPDGWTFEQTRDAFTPLLQQPRAQKLLRIFVPSGWEPSKYEWSSVTWAKYGAWGRQVLPNALILLHTVCDVDAPVGTDAAFNDDDKIQNPGGNAAGWGRVAPNLHGWLTQTCTWERKDGHDDPNHPDKTNFQNWLDWFNPSERGSLIHRFANGYVGWPRSSAWGDGKRLRVYCSEYLAYWSFWSNVPEAVSQQWGDACMAAGSDGYLDGGSVPVPVRR